MEPISIPTRVDDPPHILLWSADELAPIIIGMLIGMMIEQALYTTTAGWLVARQYSKFRDNHADGYLLHILYWYGFSREKKSMPLTMIRRFFP